MKKILLGTTALVAASAMSAGVAKADFSISGDAYSNFGLTVSEDKGETHDGGLQTYQDAGLYFNASGEMDNGMTSALVFKFSGNNGAGGMNEMYFSLSDDWGTLQMGGDDSAADRMSIGAGGAAYNGAYGGSFGSYLNSAYSSPNSFMNVTGSVIGGDLAGVSYFSPNINGLTFGLSYQPNTSAATDGGADDTGNNNNSSAYVKYSGDMDGVSISVGGGIEYVASSNNGGAGGDDDIARYQTGINIGVSGFGAKVAYNTVDYKTTTTAKVDSWTVATALSYSAGANSVSVQWVTAETKNGTVGQDRDGDAYAIAYAMDLGSGVYWDAALTKFDVSDSTAGNSTARDADFTAFEVGFGLSF